MARLPVYTKHGREPDDINCYARGAKKKYNTGHK